MAWDDRRTVNPVDQRSALNVRIDESCVLQVSPNVREDHIAGLYRSAST